ncbi:MAG: energy-coupling factor transporter ATPase [Ruminococcaceae bacterium]|nr:energy-coupling factor transporter ATPase [Oscillospiraceae bacterium]
MEQSEKIVLDHVSYVYGEGTPFEMRALDDVSLSIRSGKITGIIGHTGSGKSTLVQLLNGLIKPTSGQVLLDGYNINSTFEKAYEEWNGLPEYASLTKRRAKRAIREEWKKRQRELCFRVGLVMQYPEYQLFEDTVYKDIAFGPTNMGLSHEEIDTRVREAARFNGVEDDWLEKSPFDLSGGQKRRVAVAGVVAMRPEVLVLDEPAAGLDPRGRSRIFGEIVGYQRETSSTVLIVSHSMEDMARFCDDIIVMSHGKAILHGRRETVFSHVEELEAVGLDIPQITHLMRLLRERGLELPENVYTVAQAVEILKTALPKMTNKGTHI